MPRKKGTLEKVTEVATGASQTVRDVSGTVEGIAGAISEVAHAIKEGVEKAQSTEVAHAIKEGMEKAQSTIASKQAKSAPTGRKKPQVKTPRLSAGKKQPPKRPTTKKR